MQKKIFITIILFFINVYVYYLAVNKVALSDNLYFFWTNISPIISTGPFYMSFNYQTKKPIKCVEKSSKDKNLSNNEDDVLSKKFSKQLTRFCYSIKVFTVINLLCLFLITIFPIFKFKNKKAELYLLGALILSYVINISLVGAVFNKLQRKYRQIASELPYNVFNLVDYGLKSGYNTMVGIMIYYIVLFAVKLFFHNFKLSCKK